MLDPGKVRSPRDLLAVLGNVSDADQRMLAEAEEQAQRALIWNSGDGEKQKDHSVLSHLHRVHLRIAEAYSKDPKVASQVRDLLRDPLPSITFLHPCEHFSRCYAINRFMALLILTVEARNRKIRYLPGTTIANVSSASSSSTAHACGDPNTCHGKLHDISIAARACQRSAGPARHLDAFNVIVLRHGLDADTKRLATLSVRRQLLPYKRL
jgi:hypothetical protein